jgi:hypothetical protein
LIDGFVQTTTANSACTLLANSNNGRRQTPHGASSAQPRSRCNATYCTETVLVVLHAEGENGKDIFFFTVFETEFV